MTPLELALIEVGTGLAKKLIDRLLSGKALADVTVEELLDVDLRNAIRRATALEKARRRLKK